MRQHDPRKLTFIAVIGTMLTGGLLFAGGVFVESKAAVMTHRPMDRSIVEYAFVGSEFDDGYFGPTTLISHQDAVNGNYDAGADRVPMVIAGDPAYGDFDGDNDLDAALEVAPMAGGATPVLYIWLWEDGEVVQVPYPAAWPSDCGDELDGFAVVDDHIRVDMTIGDRCAVELDLETVSFTVAVEDGFPVQISPGYGAVSQCANHDHIPVLDEPEQATVHVAQSTDAPQIDASSYDRVEVLNMADPYGTPGTPWRLVRLTAADGTVNCGWTHWQDPP